MPQQVLAFHAVLRAKIQELVHSCRDNNDRVQVRLSDDNHAAIRP